MSDNTVTLHTEPSHAQLRIAIYSDRPQLREDVHSAFGTSIAPDLPAVDVIDFATGPALIRALHNKRVVLHSHSGNGNSCSTVRAGDGGRIRFYRSAPLQQIQV